jgi:hypothetical protein
MTTLSARYKALRTEVDLQAATVTALRKSNTMLAEVNKELAQELSTTRTKLMRAHDVAEKMLRHMSPGKIVQVLLD